MIYTYRLYQKIDLSVGIILIVYAVVLIILGCNGCTEEQGINETKDTNDNTNNNNKKVVPQV